MERSLSAGLQGQSQGSGGGQAQITDLQTTTKSFNAYLTVFSINTVHRFPDVNDINLIDYDAVRKVAEFSAVASQVALQIWDDLSQEPPTRSSKRRMG